MPRLQPNGVDLITADDKQSLLELRAESYQQLYGTDVDVSGLHWNSWDGRSLHIGVFQNNILMSALRVTKVTQPDHFQQILLDKPDLDLLSFPLLILSRAATKPGCQSQGLHTWLRLNAFYLAHACNTRWIVGTLKQDAHRVGQLKDMGYVFNLNPTPWTKFLKSSEPAWIASFDLKANFEKAENRMLKSTGQMQKKFPVLFKESEALNLLNWDK